MSEQPVPASQVTEEPMSFLGKAAGVFYQPSKVFKSMKTHGVRFVDWFAPLALMIIIAGVSSYVQLNTPSLRLQIVKQREATIERAVKEGKITAEDASQQKEMVDENLGTGSDSAIVLRIFAVSVVLLITFFIVSLVWYLVGKLALDGSFDYTRAMAVTGLSNWIACVGLIVAIVISVLSSRIDGGFQLGMLMTMNPQSAAYVVLSKLNLFTIWSLVVVSIGLGAFSGKKGFRAALWVFGISILWQVVSIGFTRIFFS